MALPQLMGEITTRTHVGAIDPERARAYALATNDPNPTYLTGVYAPPVFAVVPGWDALTGVVEDFVPPESRPLLLHVEQDMRFSRPLVPGTELRTTAEPFALRVLRSGTWLTVRLASEDGEGEPVVEQLATMFIRSLAGGTDFGPAVPDHRFPAGARDHLVATATRHVDADQTLRYRDASGDGNAIHVDDAAAQAAGLPGVIVHGLCTMAVCGSVVVDEMAGGDPARLARLAVRFSKPVFPGSDVQVSIFDAGDGAVAFEARSRGDLVVRDGRAELRA